MMFAFSGMLRCFRALPRSGSRWASKNGHDPSHHRSMKSTAMQAFPSSGYSRMSPSRSLRLAVRRYLQLKDILSVPDWLQHYRFAPTPAYLAGFADITELDDFTGPNRLKENCTRYISAPSLNLGY